MKKRIFIIMTSTFLILLACSVVLFFLKMIDINSHSEVAVSYVMKEKGEGIARSENEPSDIKLEDTTETEPLLSKKLTFIAVGDILLGRSVKQRIIKKEERYLYPFLKVEKLLNTGDVVFGNLEESITSSQKGLTGIHEGGKYVLKNDVEAIKGIKFAGFNLLSLANNHILDYYETGLFETQTILAANNIHFAGAGKNIDEARELVVIVKNGIKIGLLAYTDMAYVTYKGNPNLRFVAEADKAGVAPTKENDIKEDVLKAKGKVDLLAVSFHWGVENSFYATKEQVRFAHDLIDSGVDIILGHHPHRTQGVEIYKGKPIFYSLGNFIFDQNVPENMEGFIMAMEFQKTKLVQLKAIPYKILNKSQIVPQTGIGAERMLQRQIKLCEAMDTKAFKKEDSLVFDLK